MAQSKTKGRSKATFDLPDELIQELVLLGKKRHISVRQFIRMTLEDIALKSRTEISAGEFRKCF
jgi:hypothetical protein